jgi:hypothetical protein
MWCAECLGEKSNTTISPIKTILSELAQALQKQSSRSPFDDWRFTMFGISKEQQKKEEAVLTVFLVGINLGLIAIFALVCLQ